MIGVFVSNKFDAKVINYKCEHNWLPYMSPEPWHELVGMVLVSAHVLHKQVIGDSICNRNSIHSAFDTDIDPFVAHHVVEIVLVNDFLWDHFDWQTHKIWAIHWSDQVEIGDIHSEVVRSRCG